MQKVERRKSQVKCGVRSPKFIWAPCKQLYSLAEISQPPEGTDPPAFGLKHEGAMVIAKIDDVSLWPPGGNPKNDKKQRKKDIFTCWELSFLEQAVY